MEYLRLTDPTRYGLEFRSELQRDTGGSAAVWSVAHESKP